MENPLSNMEKEMGFNEAVVKKKQMKKS